MVMVKGSDGKPLGQKAPVPGGVLTDEFEWRAVNIRFNALKNTVCVNVGGHQVMDRMSLGAGIRIPSKVCWLTSG